MRKLIGAAVLLGFACAAFAAPASSLDKPNTIALRDGTGSFAMNTLALDGDLLLTGTVYQGGTRVFQILTFNTFVGPDAGNPNVLDNENTAIGWKALGQDTNGALNTATGSNALGRNTKGGDNVATGGYAMWNNTLGGGNTAAGVSCLVNNVDGFDNAAFGGSALSNNVSGSSNIALGTDAGFNITGSYNIDIGNTGNASEDSTMRIGTEPVTGGVGAQSRTFIAGIKGAAIAGGVPVVIDPATSQLGILPSSIRFKTDIREMGDVSESLMKLRPVVFKYKPEYDPKGIPQYGLIAEEVAKLYPDLVAYDADGRPQTVRYQALDAMLLNELQKEHQEVARLTRANDELKEELARKVTLLENRLALVERTVPRP